MQIYPHFQKFTEMYLTLYRGFVRRRQIKLPFFLLLVLFRQDLTCMIKVYKIYTSCLLYQSLVWTFCQKEEEVVCFAILKVMLGPVQKPNFS